MNRRQLDYEVLVIGASLEGCIAALETAKSGKKVLLTEENGSLGGMATNGLITYLSAQGSPNAKCRDYANSILKNAWELERSSGVLYHDQKLKLVLTRWLKEAGVTILTHMYLADIKNDDTGLCCRFYTKTDILDIRAAVVLDATDTMKAAGNTGLTCTLQKKQVQTAVKFGGIPTSFLKETSSSFMEENSEELSGILILDCHMNWNGLTFFSLDLPFYHNSYYHETIITGLTTSSTKTDIFAMSNIQAGLRIFAYFVKDLLKKKYPFLADADIIEISPTLDCYGLRRFHGELPKGLLLINNDRKNYSNLESILLGLKYSELAINYEKINPFTLSV